MFTSSQNQAAGRIRLLLATVAALALLGWAAIARAEHFTATEGRYLPRQVVWTLAALAAAGVSAGPSYRTIGQAGYPMLALSITSLAIVYGFPAINGAHRWIAWGGIGFQPSEFAKLAVVFALAQNLASRDRLAGPSGLCVPLLLVIPVVLLVLKEPDLGTAALFLPILGAMLLAAGARGARLAQAFMLGLSLLPLLWSQMSLEQRSRITALAQQNSPGAAPTADGYQLHQAKQLRALGGTWGSWLVPDESLSNLAAATHLPAATTDFILAVVGERFGTWGTLAVVVLEGALVWQALAIALATRDPFGRLLASGIGAMFASQAVINVAMNLGFAPVVGLSLPWVSYGGSGLLVQGFAVGMLINVARNSGYELANEPFRFSFVRPAGSTRLARWAA